MKISEVVKVDENAAAAPASKGFSRFLPGVGLAASGYDAYNRAKRGDWTGAALSGAGGLASFIPGIGTAASLGLAAANAMRDKQRTGSYFPTDTELDAANPDNKTQTQPVDQQPAQPTLPPGADPKVYALQQQLIAKGAKITLDGKMGPQTQNAMKQFGMAEEIKEEMMTESEKIAELRMKLQQIDEGPMDVLRGAWQGAKNIGSAFRAGVADPAGAKALAPAATNAGEKAALKTGAAIARNPGKTALAGTALGAAGGAALTSPGQVPPGAAAKPAAAKPAGGAAKPAAKPAAAQPLNAQEEQELALLAKEFEPYMGKLPQLDALLLKHQKIRGDIPQP